MKPISLIRGFVTVGVWTLLSRILGFVRDIMIAAFLGAGPVAEAFLIAFSLPNMFRRFFAEGAFNMAFIPIFSKKLEKNDGAGEFARDAFAGMALLLTGFTALGVIFMPGLVWLMASGFAEDNRFDLATQYGRIAFPYILFISLSALISGVLNATGRFMAAAAAPVLLNVIFITAVIAAILTGASEAAHPDRVIGMTLAWAVPVGGIAQLALVWLAARRAGYDFRPRRPRLTPDLKRLAAIAAPAALAGGVVQINLLIGRQVASHFDGAVAWLSYADRLYQLPLGVVGIAIGVVLLPDLSRRLGANDTAGGRDAFNRAAEVTLALTIPAAVALIAIPVPLVSVLFERGAFTSDDTAATALAVAVYGLGLPAFVLQKVLQPLYFAREDTRRPFFFAVVAMLINAALAVGLASVIGYLGAAFGTTLAAWAMVVLLWRGSRGMGDAAVLDDRFRRRFWRILVASAVMGVVVWWLAAGMTLLLGAATIRYAALLFLVVVGIVTYFGVGQLVGAFQISEFRSAMRRR
ncbi:murein biosynthesis integral membrane protein MurJ [Ponticoccus sp. SC2-23]|uniref:murein biosynthesis integral membrane protein MurJ n=1 Tax=Alexandriicola marinus TaxID=2081710 RepID=UPI000FD8DF32|nr:murein biosynthesis integral membrane protein MurJ [Alexandriicola marinus]MBM1220143.1 murein biosynthesis integral membrane protein MurJ [Ponticoccus sp. SC6-9]MBM1224829.1 murein biosynthesis integral membrane protein MurJ [Ponticoccus sp. SC6-15]MBM1228343.1 murein biosynthesis integral membrane protein MurJ [Ponticoccus sp. SC6-38]MBM1234020.1 murein biosynthesis integral membrane protein MurJ [Ponticoccus sp. SC6-45]MBM1238844.1 murein biosynthesis integral membrane protein MurJ [Pont